MADIKILTEIELRKLIHLEIEAVQCIEDAFRALSSGKVVMPPILSMAIVDYNGEVDIKTAYVPGIESFAIKMSPGFFDNPKIGLPSTSGLMILFSAKTGMLEALLLDNGYLTDLRTAAAGAVAAKHLSRENSTSACIVGTGMQARLQLKALTLVRPITNAVIWGRNESKARQLAADLSSEYELPVTHSPNLQNALEDKDIIVTTTPSNQPLISADWLQNGQHITAMGSDQGHKNEIEAACLTRADLYVADRFSQTEIMGELRSAIEAGISNDINRKSEIGDIIEGTVEGRVSEDQITVADLTGTGIQDTAIATFVFNRAQSVGVGIQFNN